jgi:periplasmic protein TonB
MRTGRSLQTSPYSVQTDPAQTPELQQVEQKIEALKNEQQRLVQQLKQALFQLSSDSPLPNTDAKTADALAERKKELTHQLAQIEKQSQSVQGGPKKRYIGPATQEVSFARYYDKMRRTIELTGTENFPQAAGQKLYGQLTMVISLDNMGRVLNTEVASGSGQLALDQRAQAIVRGASPFGAFTPDMNKQADQLVVVTRFQFARDETLETNMLAPVSSRPLKQASPSSVLQLTDHYSWTTIAFSAIPLSTASRPGFSRALLSSPAKRCSMKKTWCLWKYSKPR